MEAGIKATDHTHLLERLNGGLNCRLILILAPANSGKTELLQQWTQQILATRADRVTWLCINAQNNEPGSFLADLISALQVDIAWEENALVKHKNRETFYLEDGFIKLINALAGTPGETVVILDNYHLIKAAEIHDGIGLMLEYLPPQAHIVIASQTEPPLPIARLRVRRQVLEIGPKDF